MRDLLIEIYGSVRRNKLRTCLTGFAVAWGIFMLIVLLGAGNGLKNGISANMADVSLNSMTVYPGTTSMPYEGLKQDRMVRMEQTDIRLTKSAQFAANVGEVAPILSASGFTMTYGKRYTQISFYGVTPLYNEISPVKIITGRFINANDEKDKRKSIVISSGQAELLFGDMTDMSSVVGRHVTAGDLVFVIVGVYKSDSNIKDITTYIPYSTLEAIFSKDGRPDYLMFTFHGLDSEEANEEFEDRYRAVINRNHRAAPSDKRALWIDNSFIQSLQMDQGMHIITVALWIMGLFTLLSGIVGVSNIMLITVKERTHEFGIRKAIGASPRRIIGLIIAESITITTFFGYIGMVCGMLGCGYLDHKLGGDVDVLGYSVSAFKDPTVGLDVALEATLVLIIAGTVAGLIPALKAGRVRPIEALRAD